MQPEGRVLRSEELSGEGARRLGGRWNKQGTPAVYLSEHPGLALLEVLVHLEIEPDDLPPTYKVLKIEAPDSSWDEIGIDKLAKEAPDWRTNEDRCRAVSEPWFHDLRTPLLRVLSTILPREP
jgi:RES domain-containing protein